MKRHLPKLFLLAAGLLAGSAQVQAQKVAEATVKMTYVDYANADTSFGEIGTDETALAGYNKISNDTVRGANTSWGATYVTYLQVDASSIGTDAVISSVTLTIKVSGSTDSKRVTTYGAGYNTSTWSESLTWNTADLSITTVGETVSTSTQSASTFEEKTIDITDAFKDDADNVVTILIYETAAAGGYIMNPSAEVIYYDASSAASYTVKYVDEDGNEIKDAATYTGLIDDYATVSEADMEAIWVDDVKYIYSSDDSDDKIIAEDNSTVVTLTFRKGEIYSYAIYDSVNDDEIQSGSAYEGESVTIYYPQYINVDGTLYSAATQNSGYYYTLTLSSDNTKGTVTYTDASITNVVFLAEGEDIEGMTVCTGANSLVRSSKGGAAYAESEDVIITTLQAGTYVITLETFNSAGTAATYTFTAGETSLELSGTAKSNKSTATSEEFVLEEASSLVLTAGAGEANAGIDLIYITGTVSDSTNGISDLSSAKSLDASAVYNLQGVRVENPTKGLYIQNGKKVIIK